MSMIYPRLSGMGDGAYDAMVSAFAARAVHPEDFAKVRPGRPVPDPVTCLRIQCGSITQEEAGLELLADCSFGGFAGAMSCASPLCAPYCGSAAVVSRAAQPLPVAPRIADQFAESGLCGFDGLGDDAGACVERNLVVQQENFRRTAAFKGAPGVTSVYDVPGLLLPYENCVVTLPAAGPVPVPIPIAAPTAAPLPPPKIALVPKVECQRGCDPRYWGAKFGGPYSDSAPCGCGASGFVSEHPFLAVALVAASAYGIYRWRAGR